MSGAIPLISPGGMSVEALPTSDSVPSATHTEACRHQSRGKFTGPVAVIFSYTTPPTPRPQMEPAEQDVVAGVISLRNCEEPQEICCVTASWKLYIPTISTVKIERKNKSQSQSYPSDILT